MKIQDENGKRVYCLPQIEKIKLDREISLILASDDTPPGEPEWGFDQGDDDPYQSELW